MTRTISRAFEIMSRIVGVEYADVRMAEWKYSELPDEARKQRLVLDRLRSLTEFESGSPTSKHLVSNLLFVGPPGTGKDRMAAWLAKVATSERRSVRKISGPDLFAAMRGVMTSDGGEEELVQSLCSVDFLILSDPCPPGGDLKDFQASTLYRIVDRRVKAGRPCWVTINARSSDEARGRVTSQTWDRLIGGAIQFLCFWTSYRQPAETVGAK